MAFCGNCGTKIDEGAKFCPGCGAAIEAPAAEQAQAQQTPPAAEQAPAQQTPPAPQPAPAQQTPPAPQPAPAQQTPPAAEQNGFAEKIAALNDTADTTADFDGADIEQNKIMAILAYLSWLVLIPIFAAPKSKFARFHANQGLVLAITEIIWWIVTAVLDTILYSISWTLGSIFGTLLGLVNLVFLVLLVVGIMNAAGGKAKELPVIGKFKILK